MPLPVSKDKGKVMEAIKKHHPDWPLAQKRAVMLSQTRKAGAKIPKKPKTKLQALAEKARREA